MAEAETYQSISRTPPAGCCYRRPATEVPAQSQEAEDTMNWIWLNMPLGALIFLAIAGIPLWMVIRHPDTGPDAQAARRAAQTPARVPVYVPRARRP